MAKGFKAVLDPLEAPLELVLSADRKSGYAMLAPLKKTTPQREPQWASNVDTEGELSAGSKDKNIEIAPKLRIYGRDEEDFRGVQLALEQKVNKMADEGGTFRLYYPDGSWIDYEVRAISGGERLFDNRFVANCRTEDEITFVCAPFGEGEKYLAAEVSGAGRVLSVEIGDIPGTAPAKAEAEVISPGADAWELLWGRESRSYTGDPTSLAYYQAGELTPAGGAKTGTRTIEGKSGTPVVKQVLNPNWTAQLTTDLISGARLTHVGVFEVLVWVHMPLANAGEVGVGFQYASGDLQVQTELTHSFFPTNHPREGRVVRVSLGQVFLPPTSQQWRGQVITRSTITGDEVDILAMAFRPLAEGNGRISAEPALSQPAALLIRDEFNQSAGNLNGKQLSASSVIAGPANPTVAVSAAGAGTPWTNPGNALASDNTYAVAALPVSTAESQLLNLTKYGMGIPTTATITGIELQLEVSATAYVPTVFTVNSIQTGTIGGSSRTESGLYSPTDVTLAFGGPNDLWGRTWTATQVNNEGTGFSIRATKAEGKASSINVDVGRLVVYYTETTTPATWVTSGDATDITVETTGHTAQRSENNDAAWYEGRWAVAGTTTATDVVVGISAKHTAVAGVAEVVQAVAGRYVDANNFLFFCFNYNPAGAFAVLNKRVGGAVSPLASIPIPETTEWHTLRLQIDRRGRYFCWLSYVESGVVKLLAQGQDSDLATGGPLASGKTAWEDACVGAGTSTRNYDQFVAWIPPLNAAIYQGLALRLGSSVVERQGPNGAWASITPEGDYLKLAPAGLEGRKNRLVLIASPHDPDTMPVGFPTELKTLVWVTPRYRGVPDVA